MVRHRKRAEAMTAQEPRSRQQPKQLDAGILQAEISSFALRLAAEGKAAKTIRTYTEAVQWFAAARLPGAPSRVGWEQAGSQDIQQWMTLLLDRYSNAYASNQYRVLQQFFKWLAAEDGLPDPMAGLQPPPVTDKLVPVFTTGELTKLEQACAGRTFAQRRDTAIISVFKATGIRLAELAGLRYDPGDARCSDIDLWQREITVRGKGGKDRIVRIGHQAARSLDRYLRARSRHAQAWRPQLWLGAGSREPLTAAGIYQVIARRGLAMRRGRLPAPVPAPFQPHLAGSRRSGGGPDGAQRLGLPADAPPLRCQRPQRPCPPHLRPHHDRHLTTPAPSTPAPALGGTSPTCPGSTRA